MIMVVEPVVLDLWLLKVIKTLVSHPSATLAVKLSKQPKECLRELDFSDYYLVLNGQLNYG